MDPTLRHADGQAAGPLAWRAGRVADCVRPWTPSSRGGRGGAQRIQWPGAGRDSGKFWSVLERACDARLAAWALPTSTHGVTLVQWEATMQCRELPLRARAPRGASSEARGEQAREAFALRVTVAPPAPPLRLPRADTASYNDAAQRITKSVALRVMHRLWVMAEIGRAHV